MSRWIAAAVVPLVACTGDAPELCPGRPPVRTVVADQSPLVDLALDAESVYSIDSGTNEVRRVSKGGGSAENGRMPARRGISRSTTERLLGRRVGGVSSVSKTGGTESVLSPDLECSSALPCGDAIAVDADAVYWVADFSC